MSRQAVEVDELAGAISDTGLVFGCYIHGLFDSPDFRLQLLNWLCVRKGIESADAFQCDNFPDEYDRLADLLEEHIDLKYWSDKGKG